MTLQAMDMEPSSPSPLPDGTSAPSNGDAVAEPMATSEAAQSASAPEPAPTPSSSGGSPHAKPPAASLISIAVKHKPATPAKTGDLTRLFEIARRQAKAPSEPPPAEPALIDSLLEPVPEDMPVAAAPAPSPMETSVAEALPEPTRIEIASEPTPVEPAPEAAPPVMPEVMLEAAFPLMLAPPADAVEDPAVHPLEPILTPVADAPVDSEPDWARAAAAAEADLSFEMPEPLRVSLVPMDEAPVEPAHEETEPATPTAPTMVAEPTPQPMDQPVPPIAAAPVEPPADPVVVAPVESLPSLMEALEPEPPVAVAPVEPPPSPTDAPQLTPAVVAVAPVEPLAAPAPAVPAVRTFKDLADYWRSLRSGDDHPAPESIDRELVTERWPGTLLIAYTPASQDPRGELRPGRVTRLGSACAETQSVVDAGSHSTEWMLEVARTALVNDEGVEEQQRLATMMGVAGFRMVALPLGPARGLANAVLCTLMPCANAPRFGKRRIWL